MGVSLQAIGCGDAFGSGGQINTCFHVRGSSVQILIDCGATSLPAFKKYHIDVKQIDQIILSHFHGDHFGGVPFLLLELAIYGQIKPLTILGPPGCRDKVASLSEMLYPGSVSLEKLQVDFIEYKPYEPITTQQVSLQAFPVIHTEQALPHGVRITIDDKVISYSGDTEWTDVLIELSKDADLFVCECDFYRRQVKGHLNYSQLEENLGRLKHKKITLTHFDVEMLHNLRNIELDYLTEGKLIDIA